MNTRHHVRLLIMATIATLWHAFVFQAQASLPPGTGILSGNTETLSTWTTLTDPKIIDLLKLHKLPLLDLNNSPATSTAEFLRFHIDAFRVKLINLPELKYTFTDNAALSVTLQRPHVPLYTALEALCLQTRSTLSFDGTRLFITPTGK